MALTLTETTLVIIAFCELTMFFLTLYRMRVRWFT